MTTTTAGGRHHAGTELRRTPAQLAATAVAVTFLLVGILGFVPGIVTDFDDMSFAGHDSGAQLLGIFQVSVLHNVVHLLFGVVGLALVSRGARAATQFLVVGGVVYLLLAVYGVAIGHDDSSANFIPVNQADTGLHLGLGITMIAAGVVTARKRAS
jgi:hypothetical protein